MLRPYVSYQRSYTRYRIQFFFSPKLTITQIGDPREAVRLRVQQVIQTLPKIYAYSRIFHLLMDYGLKSKIAKARQGSMDEITGILTRAGISACDPSKAFPVMASCISDKDASVRKSALTALRWVFAFILSSSIS